MAIAAAWIYPPRDAEALPHPARARGRSRSLGGSRRLAAAQRARPARPAAHRRRPRPARDHRHPLHEPPRPCRVDRGDRGAGARDRRGGGPRGAAPRRAGAGGARAGRAVRRQADGAGRARSADDRSRRGPERTAARPVALPEGRRGPLRRVRPREEAGAGAVVACSPREGSRGRPAAARGRRRLTGNTSESPRVVRRTSDRRRAEEWSFVLRALAVIHEIREEESGYGIAVLPEDEAQAAAALDAHEAERAEVRAPLPEYGPSGAGWVFAVFLLAVHLATGA